MTLVSKEFTHAILFLKYQKYKTEKHIFKNHSHYYLLKFVIWYLRNVLYEFFSRKCLPSFAFLFSSTQYVLTPNPTSTVISFVTGSLIESAAIQIGVGFMVWIMTLTLLVVFFFLQSNNKNETLGTAHEKEKNQQNPPKVCVVFYSLTLDQRPFTCQFLFDVLPITK